MLVKTHSATVNGLTALSVAVEVHTAKSAQTNFIMVGLPDNAVRESRSRVTAALQNSKIYLREPQTTTVNLAPADVRKEGTGFDLPVAIGMVAAGNIMPTDMLDRYMLVGELGLDGSIRPIKGALPIAIKARAEGFEGLIVPEENVREAAVVNQLKVYGANHLTQVIAFLSGEPTLEQTIVNTREEFYQAQAECPYDFSEVKGQENVKRAFEVAAAGGHNLMLIGAPGCGKSMMAKRMPSILPRLTLAESLETTQIHSIAGCLASGTSLITRRPFRAPHHTVSDVALIGGGATFQPGEISLAHNGVLFMDELPEFSKVALETLRQPLEDRVINISRAKYRATLPCSFMLVAAMNPCPCGYYNHPTRRCDCTPGQVQRYKNKISGPLLDRLDMHVEVVPVSLDELTKAPAGESSAQIRERVEKARAIQAERFKDSKGIHCNAQMTDAQINTFATPDAAGEQLLRAAIRKHDLSARAYNRILKVARTIADLEGASQIQSHHIAEAVGYRSLERASWGE